MMHRQVFTVDSKGIPRPAFRGWTTVRRTAVAGVVLSGLLNRGSFAVDTRADDPQTVAQTLYVRQRMNGAWSGWVVRGNRRKPVDIPQSKEAIQQFADEHGVNVDWGADETTSQGRTNTLPPVAQSRVESTTESAPPTPVPAVTAGKTPESGSPESASAAEQITRIERTIQADAQRLSELSREASDPKGEFQQAQEEFKRIEAELVAKQADVSRLEQSDQQDKLQSAREALSSLTRKRDLARQRFDLAIQTRKTVQEQLSALEEKIRQNRLALDKLTGDAPPAEAQTLTPEASGPAAIASTSSPAVETSSTATPPAQPEAANNPPATAETEQSPADPPALDAESESAELREALQVAEQKKEDARAAALEAQSISERIQTLKKTIDLEQRLFETARQKSDLAYQQQQSIQADYEEKSASNAAPAELNSLDRQRKENSRQFEKARSEVAERTDRLNQLQAELAALQADELVALQNVEQKQGAAAEAEEQVGTLKNPFSTHNMLQWLLDHGPRIALIVAGIVFLRMLLGLFTRKIIGLMIKTGARGTQEQREDRARTLAGVFQNAGSLTIIVSGTLMICDEVGIAVGPLMGGAAVLGLAVAFGAQNLIRDYFYGFVILLENQYKLNDVLKIGDISGQVERITLRMTVLRDLEGRVHFIPNGKIDSVTNMTHGWSRAVFDIGVAYKEDADEVMNVLMDLARGLRDDPQMGAMILDEPEMLGVDALGDSAVILKFVIKTRPLKQWAVKRELLRRIKRRFDELGIEIPFPHRTIYHHPAAGSAAGDQGDYEIRRAA